MEEDPFASVGFDDACSELGMGRAAGDDACSELGMGRAAGDDTRGSTCGGLTTEDGSWLAAGGDSLLTSPLTSSEYATVFEAEEDIRFESHLTPIPYEVVDAEEFVSGLMPPTAAPQGPPQVPPRYSSLYADEEELPDALASEALQLPELFPDIPLELLPHLPEAVVPRSALRTAPPAPIPRPGRALALPSPPSSPRRKVAPKWRQAPMPVWRREPEAVFIFEPFPDQFSCPLRLLRAQLWSYVPRVRGQRWRNVPPILRALHLVLIIGLISPGIRRTTVCCILPFLTAIHVSHWGWLLGRLAAALSLIKYCDTHGMHDEGCRSPTLEELDEFKLKMATPAVHRRLYMGLSRHFSGLPADPQRDPCIIYFNSPTANPFVGNLVTYGLLYNGISAADFDDELTYQLIAPTMADPDSFGAAADDSD